MTMPDSGACKFGKGEQIAAECPMIYLHIEGYYAPEQYYDALSILCPNCPPPASGNT